MRHPVYHSSTKVLANLMRSKTVARTFKISCLLEKVKIKRKTVPAIFSYFEKTQGVPRAQSPHRLAIPSLGDTNISFLGGLPIRTQFSVGYFGGI